MNATNIGTLHPNFTSKKQAILLFNLCACLLLSTVYVNAQTKKLNRPKSPIGIASVDSFVGDSFDFYDKVYTYDAYAKTNTPLEDEDLDILEDALEDITNLSESAQDIIADLDGLSVLKQAKATLHINRAKKALKYSLKTTKDLLLGKQEQEEDKAPEKDKPIENKLLDPFLNS